MTLLDVFFPLICANGFPPSPQRAHCQVLASKNPYISAEQIRRHFIVISISPSHPSKNEGEKDMIND